MATNSASRTTSRLTKSGPGRKPLGPDPVPVWKTDGDSHGRSLNQRVNLVDLSGEKQKQKQNRPAQIVWFGLIEIEGETIVRLLIALVVFATKTMTNKDKGTPKVLR